MQAIIELYGFKEGLTTSEGRITNWPYDEPQPTQEELDQLIATYEANNAYKKLRAREYPSVEEQLDHIYHNGIDSWKNTMIKPIKDKYPKPAGG